VAPEVAAGSADRDPPSSRRGRTASAPTRDALDAAAPVVVDDAPAAAEVVVPQANPTAVVVAAKPAFAVAAVSTPPSVSPVTAPSSASASPARSTLTAYNAPQATTSDLETTVTVVALALTAVLQMGVMLTLSALNPVPPSPATVTPTLHVNGLDLVPGSIKDITSFYGRWTYLPGAPTLMQGRQEFNAVDPNTDARVGTFGALVSRGTGLPYTALLVTSNDGNNVGVAVGQQPPVGSLITNFQLGPIGLSYSAMPTPSGDVVSFTITTPLGDLPVAVTFDGAKGIADHTVDNRPIVLGNGFSIAPAAPDAEILTAISGVLPLFSTVQGHQTFSVYDSAGNPVGDFDGVFTTTADIIGTYTQAVMVTANDGINVGTAPGQVPPVGTVYNVIYTGTDDVFLLYSSLPSPSGDQVSMIQVNNGVVSQSALTLIDASASPATWPYSGAGGYVFVPVSALVPSGVNGLPPRDVQIQGYQQFDVYDSAGNKVGSVDADVANQWDAFGIHSEAIMVTKVTQGSVGEVPPVGSVFTRLSSGDTGFGSAESVMPTASGDLTSFKLVTPWGDIPMPSTLRPAKNRTEVTYSKV
jgi:hypothetical protein